MIVFVNSLNGPGEEAVCESEGVGPDLAEGSGSNRWWVGCKGSPMEGPGFPEVLAMSSRTFLFSVVAPVYQTPRQ